jgi:hypothetical protein
VNVRKTLSTLAIVLVVFFVVSQPAQAATMVRNIGNGLAGGGESLISFFTQLV